MPGPVLRLLDEVSYDGRPVTGERSQALLAVLAGARGHAVVEGDLVEAVWASEAPANPAKALQVVVSRTRAHTAPEVVVRVDGGYRLGDVATDVEMLLGVVRDAVRAEAAGDASTARDLAREAVGTAVGEAADAPALAGLREGVRRDAAVAPALLGRSLAALGDHAEALAVLERCVDADEATLAALLRSEAAVHGAPTALVRYERHREDVRDRLGVDPGPVLQAVHAALLAADNPVRTGLRFDATSLLGRDDDLRRLRALVRESRVVSVVGPGGLGKTRLAHVLGRGSEQPVVHFVELVGVASPDDVVGEVGSALGVRDSVSGRRVLTAEQRADVRARIAAQLDLAPTLLILDNCEHVVEAVADLVATLVATTRQLHVVTTTRAPLSIAAEHVFALGRLDDDAAAVLFRQRALAARPDTVLDDADVRRVVARLEGLPLAVELAAARVRAMSVADIDRRLDDRLALLRGSDRGRPDRHQTLVAVIDWSWNLLAERDRAGLRRLALFHDGFALDAAEALVGVEALDVVESLVGQSLLTVLEDAGSVRYRMLEMVREFGLLQLAAAADEEAARAGVRAWALDRSVTALADLHGPAQVQAVRALGLEEGNLAEVLRRSLGDDDVEAAVVLVAALGTLWTIRGEHPRVVTLVGAVESAIEGWSPPDDLVDAAASAASILVLNSTFAGLGEPRHALALIDACGARSDDPRVRAHAEVLPHLAAGDLADFLDHPDGQVAMLALQWSSHTRENVGDLEGAIEASQRAAALWRPEHGPWERALHHTQLAGLYSQLGRPERAAQHAVEALGVLDALEADDDAVQLRSVLAAGAIERGDLDEADRLVDEIAARPRAGLWGGGMALASTRAELALARGEVVAGLALYDDAVAAARRMTFPGLGMTAGHEPWVVYAESCALSAYARHGSPPAGRALLETMTRRVGDLTVLTEPGGRVDHPVVGCALFALGAWALLRDREVARAVDLLALAERFGYSRYAPSMSWERVRVEADAVAPGSLEARVASYGARRGPDLLEEARAAVAGG